jgi:hypothetical protein
MENSGLGDFDLFIAFVEQAFLFEHAFDLIGQTLGQKTGPGMFGLCIFRRDKNLGTAEIDMSDLDTHELPDPAAHFKNDLEHQLVLIIVDAVEELHQFVLVHISNHFPKSLIPVFHFDGNVKQPGLINLCCRRKVYKL